MDADTIAIICIIVGTGIGFGRQSRPVFVSCAETSLRCESEWHGLKVRSTLLGTC